MYRLSIFKSILLIAVGFLFLFCRAHADNNKSYVDANNELKAALQLNGVSRTNVISLLLLDDYDALEKIVIDLEKKYANEAKYESPYSVFFDVISPDNGDLLHHLNAWVSKRQNHVSLCSRGSYYANLALKIRGGGYIDTVSKDNIKRMDEYFSLARKDLLTAIKINPVMMPAYEKLIYIEKNTGSRESARTFIDLAIKNDSRSYFTRTAYMSSLLPQWGGSYDEMQRFIDESIKYAHTNPRIWALRGEVKSQLAFQAYRDHDCQRAIKYYSEALAYGDSTNWLKMRSWCYSHIGQTELAILDLERLLTYRPDDWEVLGDLNDLKKNGSR